MGDYPRMYLLLIVSTVLSLSARGSATTCVAELDDEMNFFWPAFQEVWWRIINRGEELIENGDKTVSMSSTDGRSNGSWKWAKNSCNPEQKYLVSRDSGLLLAADGRTLTEELEGNAWSYNKTWTDKTLRSESGGYLSTRKRKGQTVRGLRRNSSGMAWFCFQWKIEQGY